MYDMIFFSFFPVKKRGRRRAGTGGLEGRKRWGARKLSQIYIVRYDILHCSTRHCSFEDSLLIRSSFCGGVADHYHIGMLSLVEIVQILLRK